MGSFLELAGALRETHTEGLQVLARLTGITGVDLDDIEAMRRRKALLLDAAELLVEQSPHEALIRSIMRVGGLAELPEYSADLSHLAAGITGLWRGEVLDVMPLECEVRFLTQRATSRSWISRTNLIALERRSPSMWLRPPGPEPAR